MGSLHHPEVAVAKHADHAADALRFMDYDDALSCFRALVEQGKKMTYNIINNTINDYEKN